MVDKRPVFMITTHPAHNTTLVPTAENLTVIFLKHIQERTFFQEKKAPKGEDKLKPLCITD